MKRLYRAASSLFSAVAAIALALGILTSPAAVTADTPPSGSFQACQKCPLGNACSGTGTCNDNQNVACNICDCKQLIMSMQGLICSFPR